jgi:hypothetical protein
MEPVSLPKSSLSFPFLKGYASKPQDPLARLARKVGAQAGEIFLDEFQNDLQELR